MCRYCLASPPSIADNTHQVRLVIGNGLRPQIWEDFTKRFNIKKVAEFYGATEGNANMSKNYKIQLLSVCSSLDLINQIKNPKYFNVPRKTFNI